MSSEWCTIESDPGVFTALIERFGVENVELSELWSLDEDSLRALGKVYGLIFLFKWQPGDGGNDASSSSSSSTTNVPLTNYDERLFFARQMTHNACATQAILSVLFNAATDTGGDDDDLVLGPTLTNFRAFTSSFTPELLGEAIGASEEIRTAHNSFARPDSFLADQKKKKASEDDDVFHFVAYVPHGADKNVYELDGLKEGPVCVGSYKETSHQEDGDDDDMAWLSVARTAIQERIERYSASEIKFNLMAIVRDQRVELVKKLNALTTATGSGEEDDDDDDDNEEVVQIKIKMACEEQKRQQWKTENDRRRHNYLPFCVEYLKCLAASGKLPELTKKANERTMAKRRKVMMDKTAGSTQK